jgi:hypothetical protein
LVAAAATVPAIEPDTIVIQKSNSPSGISTFFTDSFTATITPPKGMFIIRVVGNDE